MNRDVSGLLKNDSENNVNNNVTVMTFDSQKMLKLAKSSYSRKVHTRKPTQTQIKRQINHQGPIKRLKSAMIRSVFNQGESSF